MTETELMPSWGSIYTEQDCGKLKKGKGFLKPNFGILPKLNLRGVRYDGLFVIGIHNIALFVASRQRITH